MVLNTSASLIAHLSRYSHIYTYMFDELHWLPLHARLQFKILTLIFKAQRGLAPKYLVDAILRPHSASSNRSLRSFNFFSWALHTGEFLNGSLRSFNRLDLLVPHSRTAFA